MSHHILDCHYNLVFIKWRSKNLVVFLLPESCFTNAIKLCKTIFLKVVIK